MIDFHNHILWGIDDGPKNIEESIEMVYQAVDKGIDYIITTPHYYEGKFEATREEIERKINILSQAIIERDLPIKLIWGQEIHLNEKLFEKLDQGIIGPLSSSQYILIELPFMDIPLYTYEFLIKVINMGYKPIIAHPERYKAIQQDINILERLVDIGCVLQLNAGSILGEYGKSSKKLAKFMIKHQKFHVIGSDAHDTKLRPFLTDKALKKVKSKDFKDYLSNNVESIKENRKIELFKYFQ
ncbi:capsular biosynthesis protein [Staphylococcus simiae]|uniref:tyrosine-protein phosphatase n=1 Tax=Staphylococcus simiae TaxID=308354 RepID=UPI001A9844A9|nr:CpsB/CapC family capsule biosynthesis tyrosine phosphatase [Staphylococcus simiae]MBO1198293.1 capsular biosynthesis protein [Staphylococcus simiae]MBO1201972.1 capsular biosynthesis protein [Staphylococcus simiae]MBO1204196.1 capsular biosynthesis protein [Staphylococcus simiae]MBO1210285.1 capsular biosynthesis protein [Staphylococcus simiae]MBO1230430.1 capsular biosynthesis protein [Staphylococcus simiae]